MDPRHFRSVGFVAGFEVIREFEFEHGDGDRYRIKVVEDLAQAETSQTKYVARIQRLVRKGKRRIWQRVTEADTRADLPREAFRRAMLFIGATKTPHEEISEAGLN